MMDKEEYCGLLAKNLSVLRVNANLKQTELAEKLGLTRVTISNYENSKLPINWKRFMSIVSFFAGNRNTLNIMLALGIVDKEIIAVINHLEVEGYNR